jgi:hypothetical protein
LSVQNIEGPSAAKPLPCFLKLVILKELKVLCFDALLQVLIIQDLRTFAAERVLTNPGPIVAAAKRKCGNCAATVPRLPASATAEYSRKWNETKGKVRHHEVRFRNKAAILAFRRGDRTVRCNLSG